LGARFSDIIQTYNQPCKLIAQRTSGISNYCNSYKKVEADIAEQMGGNLTIFRGNLMRGNFKLFVAKVNSEDEKLVWLGQNLGKIPGSGILYTAQE
jgi:ATP-dependent DNA helicase RecQ